MPVDEDERQFQSPANGAPVATSFGLPEALLAVLPTDPFEQLDLARKITSVALSTRIANLEDEIDGLIHALADRDNLIAGLRAKIEALDSAAGDLSGQLARALEEKEALLNENATLSDAVKKLNREVSKLEVFKKTLVQSLKEEDEINLQPGASRRVQVQNSKASVTLAREEDYSNPPSKSSSTSETNHAASNDGDYSDVVASKRGFDLPSNMGTPKRTPPGSPPRLAAAITPRRLSRPLSPRRHSIAVAASRNILDDRTQPGSFTSPFETGRSRIDGKEFFRQVRSRLSYEQFSAFLANVKELNSQKQTRGETLRKADEIFGPDNKDLYTIFEGLINRNLH